MRVWVCERERGRERKRERERRHSHVVHLGISLTVNRGLWSERGNGCQIREGGKEGVANYPRFVWRHSSSALVRASTD